MNAMLFPALAEYVESLPSGWERISEPRRILLRDLAAYLAGPGAAKALTFICTHNSRRSHFGQVWAAVAAARYGVEGILTWSGGTEATAFNPRAVAALQRAGFRIVNPGGDNPRYRVFFADDRPALECFSKVYDDPQNPQRDFVAVMTCSDADENCPFIPGASFRAPLTYDDPKEADGTPEETARYDERCRQIAAEMMYLFSLLGK
jgi:arsenate reductase (thioredoxin)